MTNHWANFKVPIRLFTLRPILYGIINLFGSRSADECQLRLDFHWHTYNNLIVFFSSRIFVDCTVHLHFHFDLIFRSVDVGAGESDAKIDSLVGRQWVSNITDEDIWGVFVFMIFVGFGWGAAD